MPEQRAGPRRHCTPQGWGTRYVCSLSAERCHNCCPMAANTSCAAARGKESRGGADHHWTDQRAQCAAKSPLQSRPIMTDTASTESAPKCANQGCRKARHAQDALPMEPNLGGQTPHRRCTQLRYRVGLEHYICQGRADPHRPRPPAPETKQATCGTILHREAFAGHKHIQAAGNALCCAHSHQ